MVWIFIEDIIVSMEQRLVDAESRRQRITSRIARAAVRACAPRVAASFAIVASFASFAMVTTVATTSVDARQTGAAARPVDREAEIKAVIETFRTAIIDKDEARFAKLFLFEDVPWQSVTGDENLRRARLKKPDAPKVRVERERSWRDFIDTIVASKEREEEKFWNIRIDTDGDVASVFFDYSYHAGGRETNHGKEAWHLVRTDDGWKIVSVIYSVNWDPEPAK